MDNKKIVKDFIDYVFDYVAGSYRMHGHNRFSFDLSNDPMSYIIADKAVPKRLERMFLKKLGIRTKVTYELQSSMYRYLDGVLTVKVLKIDHETKKGIFIQQLAKETQLGIEDAVWLVRSIPLYHLDEAIRRYNRYGLYELQRFANILFVSDREVLPWPKTMKNL